MSETVHFTGKIKKIDMGDLTAKEKYEVLQKRGFDLDDNYLDEFVDGGYFDCEDLITISGEIYEVIEKNETDADGDIMNAKKEEDGTISYELRYYNGGCGFDEAMEEALGKIK